MSALDLAPLAADPYGGWDTTDPANATRECPRCGGHPSLVTVGEGRAEWRYPECLVVDVDAEGYRYVCEEGYWTRREEPIA